MDDARETPPIRPELERLLLLAIFVWAGLVLVLGWSGLGFFGGDWDFLLDRRGSFGAAFGDPYNEHIVVGLALVYRMFTSWFGLDPVPFHVLQTALLAVSSVLVYLYVRRRVGVYLALVGTATTLLIGAAYQDLFWPISIGYLASFSSGLAALMLLERGDRRADLAAGALLTVATLTFTVGLAFLAGAAVAIGLGSNRARRAAVVGVPAVLFVIWWIGWGSTSDSAITLENVLTAPAYVFDGLATGFSSLLGFENPQSVPIVYGIDWGRPIAAVAIVAAAMHLIRLRGRVPRTFWVIIATAFAFWFVLGCFETASRQPEASRFQLPAAVFVLLIAAELLATVRIRRGTVIVLTLVALAAIASNANHLGHASERFERETARVRGGLTGIELTRDTVSPTLALDRRLIGTRFAPAQAAPYLEALDEYGHSPAYAEAQLGTAPAKARVAADRTMATAHGVELAPTSAAAPSGECERFDTADGPDAIAVGGGLWIEAGGEHRLRVRLARYAKEFSFIAGRIDPGERAVLRIPADRSSRPWRAEFGGGATARVCSYD